MFSKISRYRKVPNVTAPDAKGRFLASTDIRLLPSVTGAFRHTVEAGDRLDQLAYKFYSQPLQWWNIADANAEFLSPLALLGKDAVVTTRFPVTVSGVPPWASLLPVVQGVQGVEQVLVAEDVEIVPGQITNGGQKINVMVEQVSRAVLVTYNQLNVTATTLAAKIGAVGFQVLPFSDVGQVGQEIVIPPKPNS
jgi:hypothetical protein